MSQSADENAVRKWYVLRTFSGREKKVKQYLEQEADRLGLEDRLEEVLIPTEKVFEMRGGKKRSREKRFFPGYILLHAHLDGQLLHVIDNTPNVIGFLESGESGPIPLRPDEVQRILGRMDEAREAGEQPEIPYQVGDAVKVVDGPFSDFSGFVEEVFPEKMKVKVMVSIFGRKTPLELDYLQVEKEG